LHEPEEVETHFLVQILLHLLGNASYVTEYEHTLPPIVGSLNCSDKFRL